MSKLTLNLSPYADENGVLNVAEVLRSLVVGLDVTHDSEDDTLVASDDHTVTPYEVTFTGSGAHLRTVLERYVWHMGPEV